MEIEKIIEYTNLSPQASLKAGKRFFTETILNPQFDNQIIEQLADYNLKITQGGRFKTIQAKTIDKGEAVQKLVQLYQKHLGRVVQTYAVGDSFNDISMLKAVNSSFLVKKNDNTWIDYQSTNLQKIEAIGPMGFNLACQIIVDD